MMKNPYDSASFRRILANLSDAEITKTLEACKSKLGHNKRLTKTSNRPNLYGMYVRLGRLKIEAFTTELQQRQ